MSTQLVIAAAGAVVGAAFGSPQIGWAIGSFIGAAVAEQPHNDGPRLTDLKVTGTEYGDVIPWVAGHPRISGQVWWSSDRREISTTTEQGKGGGPTNTSFTYVVDALFGLTDREIAGISRIWSNGKLVWTARPESNAESLAAQDEAPWDRMTVYTGASDQMPDPVYEAAVTNAPAYRGRGSVFIEGLQLGSGGILPNLTFEVCVAADLDDTSILHAPLTEDENDTEDNPAAAAVSHPGQVSYTEAGAVLAAIDYDDDVNVSWAAEKLRANEVSYAGRKITYEVEASGFVSVSDDLGTGNVMRFLTYSSGLYEASWSTQRRGDALFVQTWSAVAFEGVVVTDHGVPNDATYGIVWDADGKTVRWTIDGDEVYSRDYNGRFGTAVNVAQHVHVWAPHYGGPGLNDARGVTSFVAKNVRMYLDDGPHGTVDPIDSTIEAEVNALCARIGMPNGAWDASALAAITKPVRALAVAQVTSARAVLDQWASAYFFEAYCTDKLYFVPRGSASVATINVDDLAAGIDSAQGESFPYTITNDLEITAQVALTYSNIDADQTAATEYSDRILTSQTSTANVHLPIGFTSQEAKAIADVMVQDGHAGRLNGQLSLPLPYARLVPTDVVDATVGGMAYRMRIVKRTDGGGVLAFDWVSDDAGAIDSEGVTSGDYAPTFDIAVPGVTEMELLDIPLLRDADNVLGHYVAATSSGTTWPGASINRSLDDVEYAEAARVSERAILGVTTTTLGAFTGVGFDETNTVTVSLSHGTLSSSTRAGLLADASINNIMIGAELIRFRTATFVDTGIYTLSGLLRGQKGTEWAMGTHAIGERVVLLQTQGLRYVGIDLPSLNAERFYRGVTLGRALSTADADAFTCEGVSLKPLAPVHLRASRNPATGDVDFTWSRRTRLATTFCGPAGIVVPLGEASEVYKVRVYSDAGMTLLLRTIDSTEEAATYTAAQISADGGAFLTVFYAQVRQVGVASIEGYASSGGFSLPLVPPDVLSSYRPTSRVVFGEFDGDLVAMDAGPDGSAIVHRTLTSSDDGITFAVSQSGAVVTGYPSGVTSWVVASSTRRLCIIYNQAAAIRLMSYVDDNTSTPTEINPGPVASGASLVPFAVAVDGVTPFVLIARPLALPFGSDFYVYTSATGTTWTLVGQLQQDGGDTNVLSPGSLGAFEALSFSPDYPAYQNANLMLIGTRWFLIGSLAIYYTDDAAAETNWFRAPTGLGEGATWPTTAIGGMAEIGSRLIAYRAFTYANLATPSVSVSADAGATWTAYRPTEQGTAELTEMFLHNGYVYLSAQTTSDPRFIRSSTGLSGSWSVVSGTGVAGSLTEFRSAGGNILASNVVTVGGTTVRQIVYSADDGATWQVSTIS